MDERNCGYCRPCADGRYEDCATFPRAIPAPGAPGQEAADVLNAALQQVEEYARMNEELRAMVEAAEAGRGVHKDSLTTQDAAVQAMAQETDRDWSKAQDWKGMDGATAFLLINRHSDGWGDVGAMMNAWLAANAATPAAVQAVGAWQDIATAPASAEAVLVVTQLGTVRTETGHYVRNMASDAAENGEQCNFRAWMPAPLPPADPNAVVRCACGYPMPCASKVPVQFCRAGAGEKTS